MKVGMADSSKGTVTQRWIWRGVIAASLIGFAVLTMDNRWGLLIEAGPLLLKGLWASWVLTLASIAIGLPLGIVLAWLRRSGPWPLRPLGTGIIEIVRATPQLMVIFWIYFAIPAMTGMRLSSWAAAIVSLSLIAAAYLAEVVRGGLKSVPQTLVESGYASGLTPLQIQLHIVLPQALRTMIPAIVAHVVMMFKITSLIYVVGINDFFRVVILINNREFAPVPLYTALAVGYFVCCYFLSWLVRRFDRGGRVLSV